MEWSEAFFRADRRAWLLTEINKPGKSSVPGILGNIIREGISKGLESFVGWFQSPLVDLASDGRDLPTFV